MMPVSELRLDSLVPVSDHVIVEHADEPVRRDAREAVFVEGFLLDPAGRTPRRPRCRDCIPSHSSNTSDRALSRCGSIPATGSGLATIG